MVLLSWWLAKSGWKSREWAPYWWSWQFFERSLIAAACSETRAVPGKLMNYFAQIFRSGMAATGFELHNWKLICLSHSPLLHPQDPALRSLHGHHVHLPNHSFDSTLSVQELRPRRIFRFQQDDLHHLLHRPHQRMGRRIRHWCSSYEWADCCHQMGWRCFRRLRGRLLVGLPDHSYDSLWVSSFLSLSLPELPSNLFEFVLIASTDPTVIQPLFNKLTPLQEGALKDRVVALASALKFPLKHLYVIDGSKRSAHSNAYFFGVIPGGNKHIVIFDTLIEKSTPDVSISKALI